MPRPARTAPSDYIYHVLARGNNRKNIFREESDYLKYLEIVARYKEQYRFRLYHYVLMTNHIHLVLEPTGQGGTLAQIMKCINLSYTRYFMHKYRWTGHFWQDRYKSIIIAKDDYLLACGSYVELNPVRAKMAADPKEYRWSSYNAYAYGRKDLLLDEHPIYEQLSADEKERRQKYRELVKGMLQEKKAMKGEMHRRQVYGSEEFTEKIGREHQLAAVINRRGRPKKDAHDDEKHDQ